MTIPGTSHVPIIVGDSDILIALIYEGDACHKQTVALARKLYDVAETIIFPVNIFVETTTTVQRKLGNQELTSRVITMITNATFSVAEVDIKIINEAVSLFNLLGSKQNTLFDACVAVIAKIYTTDAIFSFDSWYKKQGFELVHEVF